MWQKVLNSLADLGIRLQMRTVFLMGIFIPPTIILIFLEEVPTHAVSSGIVMYLSLWILLFIPFSNGFEKVVALHNINQCNTFCRSLQEGRGVNSIHLPPEKGSENDFIRLKRNMYWMGRALVDREERIAGMLTEIEEAQQQILDSIEYASAIQHQMQVQTEQLPDYVQAGAILWQPRDVVGGDSYWLCRTEHGVFVGVFDCTGHGVPGAFITLIVHSMLENMDIESLEGKPGQVLGELNRRVKVFLGQHDESVSRGKRSNDGLEMGLCWFCDGDSNLRYAGAGISMYLVSKDETRHIKPRKVGIGYREVPIEYDYTEHEVSIGDAIGLYMSTDGLFDQIGGDKGLPFGKKRFLQCLRENSQLSFDDQLANLWTLFEAFRGNHVRRDDVTVMGFSPTISPERKPV
ncbi:SpoIIE family protein phosphatase [Desulfovibrio inopinatus]|uniref:SpoIIE family protein phosphatase n=1 Tax=Desulfovibrio inopinatus TaxID=102109 RepID=UPI000419343A|nr:SpoIIE family protein phosphatase [Desulfovibrio inopinatus]